MTDQQNDLLKFPIGKFQPPEVITQEFIQQSVKEIEALPARLREVVSKMSKAHHDQSYRPGSWNARQVLYHIGDSHLHSYIRFKWALTEDSPVIKAYEQNGWAELFDSVDSDMEDSLLFIEVLHKRWVKLLKSIPKEGWDKIFVHPEMKREISLKWTVALYAWHGNHHLGHLKIIAAG